MTFDEAQKYVSQWLWDSGGKRVTVGQSWTSDQVVDVANMILDANPINIDELKNLCEYNRARSLRQGRAQQAAGINIVVNLIETMEAKQNGP